MEAYVIHVKTALGRFPAFPHALFPSNPLDPQPPVTIFAPGTVDTPTFVCSTNSGFLATWSEDDTVYASTTSNGTGWSKTPVTVEASTDLNPRACANSSAIVITWGIMAVAGGGSNPSVSYSTNGGTSWTSTNISTGNAIGDSVPICVGNQGFMASFNASQNAFSVFSANGTTNWGFNQVQITTGGQAGTLSSDYAATVAASGNTYVVAWVNTSNDGKTSYSTNNGTTWNTPISITGATSLTTEVSIVGTTAGFLAAWCETGGNIYSSFSSDGTSWPETPTLIASGANTEVVVGLSGSSTDFIATWITSGGAANASYSSNNGATWSTPVVVSSTDTPDSLDYNIIGVSLGASNYLFTWTSSSNAYSSSGPIPAPRSFRRPNNKR